VEPNHVLKGGLIGVGHVAVNGHLPGWKARTDASIVAAADARPERREALASVYPEARWYDSAEDLLSSERLDFVDICTPPDTHAMLVRQALARSLHVLCEKPLVLSREELRGLPAMAVEKDRVLVTVHNWKHAVILAKISDLVRTGAVGDVRRVRWETLRDKPAAAVGDAGNWRIDPAQSGGGILVDHGWHALYAVAQWLPAAPRTVAANLEIRKHRDFPIEDTADLFLVYPEATAEILLTWAAPERANRVEVWGTRGRLAADGGALARLDANGTTRLEEWSFPSLTEGSHHPDWFGGVIAEFLGEIAEPRTRGRNLAEASFCAQVLALAKESSRRAGEPLPIERVIAQGRR
jgi:predicted dehydrogenase